MEKLGAFVFQATWFGLIGGGVGALVSIPFEMVEPEKAWRKLRDDNKLDGNDLKLEYSVKASFSNQMAASSMFTGFLVGALISFL